MRTLFKFSFQLHTWSLWSVHLWDTRKFIFDQYVFASLKVSEQIIQNTLLRQRLSQLSLSIFDILYTINLKPLKTYFDI